LPEEKPFYGGQAVLEGVMMRSRHEYSTAVRRADGSIAVGRRKIDGFSSRHGWARWPLMRGNFALLDSLVLGMESLQFSGNIALEDETRAQAEPTIYPAERLRSGRRASPALGKGDEEQKPQSLGTAALWLTLLPALAIGIGLFVLLPTYAVGWILGPGELGATTEDLSAVIARNLVEGVIRLLLVMGYIAAISLIGYIRRVFEYHGAEHKTINALEAGQQVTVENAMACSALHPRCGTAFILVVIAVKIIVNCFLGWPDLWLRMLLRLAVLPPVAGIAYEVIHFAGRHRDSVFARALALPGLLLERLTTREADAEQVQVAIYALAAVAPEVELPDGFASPEEVRIGKAGQVVRDIS